MSDWLTPLARTVLAVLDVAPRTSEELARATHLPTGVVEAALAELRAAGRAEETEPRRWRAR